MSSTLENHDVEHDADDGLTGKPKVIVEAAEILFGLAAFGFFAGLLFVLFVQLVFGGFNGWGESEMRDRFTNEVVKLSSTDYLFVGVRWGTIIGSCLGVLGAILTLLGSVTPAGPIQTAESPPQPDSPK